MKIATIGNCQLETLSFYIKYLLPDAECYWVSFSDMYPGFLDARNSPLVKKLNSQIKCPYDPTEYIKSCNYIINLNMTERGSPDYHAKALSSLVSPEAQRVSIANFYLDVNNLDVTLEGMRRRDQAREVEITIDTLLENFELTNFYPKKPTEPNHPPAIYFLELMRHICKKFNWPFFNQADYDMFIKTGFPFG